MATTSAKGLKMADPVQEEKFLTQAELAKRWRTSQSCVKNWRDRGHLPYFRLPGSTRVLYPLQGIQEVESQFTKPVKEVVNQNERTEIKRKKPDISATNKEWRI
jgi:hypothetical protein